MSDPFEKLAVFSRREPGERRIVELAAGTDTTPSLVVEFQIPTPLQAAQFEAVAENAVRDVLRGQLSLSRYNLPDDVLDDDVIGGLSRLITAVESAKLLWTRWNYARQPADGEEPVLAPLDLEHIVEVLWVPHFRSAWNLHLDLASPLERVEGNGSGVSPNTSSDVTGEAPNTAGDAKSAEAPAPEAAPAGPESSAPASTSPQEPPKAE